MQNIELLDKLLIGRVDPYIYAFTTNTVPNYLKIGDTYRPVPTRLNEWKKYYPELKEEFREKAKVDDEVFFRDYSVHQYMENELKKEKLTPDKLNEGIYYSNEFFKDTTKFDVEQAILDIKKSYEKKEDKYQYYNQKDSLPIVNHYAPTGLWKLRDNQKEVVNNFIKAVENGRTNLLMYAVMRFGKSFTSLMCAKSISARLIVVVCAKADVKEEWKKTVESADNFNREYIFLDSNDLLRNYNIVSETLNESGVILFLTLQDLQGEVLKEKHEDIFKQRIDLLIIDESHFGARAEKYGEVLRNVKYEKDITEKYNDSLTKEEIEQLDSIENNKILRAKIKLHLSGTPYRILMGTEFEKEDIIAFCQFTDIIDEQKKWDLENSEGILNDRCEEWENPYYGFPGMIRFAFNLNSSARNKLDEYKKNGFTYAFSELFKPLSISKDSNGNYKKFKNEKEILDLFEVIDGTKDDENVLGFLDYNKIKEGKMCRHIVCVLPYCASCDALEELLKSNKDKFKNLSEYEIINISGVDSFSLYKSVKSVQDCISNFESENKKTITLTVNRMLTGSTVPQWDTMLYFKDTSSPQEYDQAIFRLQNQYVTDYINDKGELIKYNMKPQTLLVDFDPQRMFELQEIKSLIYNTNTEESGNSLLKRRLTKELSVSPIITLNKDRIVEITPEDIMSYVSNYSRSKGVLDETNEIPVDLTLLNYEEIRKVIEKQGEIGSKQGLFVDNAEGEGDDIDLPNGIDLNKIEKDKDNLDENEASIDNNKNDALNPIKQFRTYYARILFYSFLSNSNLISLDDVIKSMDDSENSRIALNLKLDKIVLSSIRIHINSFILSQLDYKIQNINSLSSDDSISKIDRAMVAINKFNKISDSEIVTPKEVCDNMVDMIPADDLIGIISKGNKILDIASKQGEFCLAFYRKIVGKIDLDLLKTSIYSIPTSTIAYEFTRKIYELLELDVENIAQKFTSYDMLDVLKNNQVDYGTISDFLNQNKSFKDIELKNNLSYKGGNKMKFSVIVGNPPYQNGRKSIFQHFQLISDTLKPDYSVLIYPGKRWIHRSGKGMEKFGNNLINDDNLAKLVYYPNSKDIFDCVDVTGGISIVYKNYKKEFNKLDYTYINGTNEKLSVVYDKPGDNLIALCPDDNTIVEKIEKFKEKEKLHYISDSVSEQKFFGIESNFVELNSSKVKLYRSSHQLKDNEIKILTNDKAGSQGRTKWFVVDKNLIKKNIESINKWKVVVSSAHPGGQDGRDNQLEILDNKSVFGRARVSLKIFETEQEANNFYKFFNSNIIKFSLLLTDENLGSFGMQTLDIIDYSNDNQYIDFNGDVDTQLAKLLGLTDAEMKYIINKLG